MAKKRKVVVARTDPVRLKVGTWVLVVRPNLWADHRGAVIGEVEGIHRVALRAFNGGIFHADVPGSELQVL